MPGVYNGHMVSCLTVQIFLVVWRKKGKVAYFTVIPYYVQVDGVDGGGAQVHGLGTTFLLLCWLQTCSEVKGCVMII